MSTTAIRTIVLNCPPWCETHEIGVDSLDHEFGGTTRHSSLTAAVGTGSGAPGLEQLLLEVSVEQATRLVDGEVIADYSAAGCSTYVSLDAADYFSVPLSPAEARSLAAALVSAADQAGER